MHPLRSAALFALLLPATHAGHATLGAQDSTVRRGTPFVGAGLNVMRDARPGGGFPLALQLGYEWTRGNSPLALRLTADYAAARSLVNPIGFVFENAGTVTTRTRDVSLGIAGVYSLRAGRLEPYLLSGAAIQRRTLAYDVATKGGADTFRDALYSAGLQGGFGVRAHIGASTLFVEARTYLPAFGDVTRRRTGTNPLTFGLRF